MKYSLKSLLILVTLFALFVGVITSIYQYRMTQSAEGPTPPQTSTDEYVRSIQPPGSQLDGDLFSAEPAYKSDPFYCKIAFGPNREKVIVTAADFEARVVYVDLNSNGNLTEDDEAFEIVESSNYENTVYLTAIIPQVKQGQDIHTDFKIKYGKTGDQVKGVFSIKLWGWDESTTDADLVTLDLSTDKQSIPMLHFNGPLTMGTYRAVTEMPRGKEFTFYSLVGTAGANGGTLTAIANNTIPDDAHPMVEFEFPHRDSSEPPIKVKSFLTVRC